MNCTISQIWYYCKFFKLLKIDVAYMLYNLSALKFGSYV